MKKEIVAHKVGKNKAAAIVTLSDDTGKVVLAVSAAFEGDRSTILDIAKDGGDCEKFKALTKGCPTTQLRPKQMDFLTNVREIRAVERQAVIDQLHYRACLVYRGEDTFDIIFKNEAGEEIHDEYSVGLSKVRAKDFLNEYYTPVELQVNDKNRRICWVKPGKVTHFINNLMIRDGYPKVVKPGEKELQRIAVSENATIALKKEFIHDQHKVNKDEKHYFAKTEGKTLTGGGNESISSVTVKRRSGEAKAHA